MPGETIRQRLQGKTGAAYPFGHGGTGQDYLFAGGNLLQTVKRQVIQVFVYYHPGKQAGGGHAAINDRRWYRFCDDDLAGFAGVLRTNVTVNEESGGLHVKLLGDVFADFNQITATLTALAGGGFMPVLNARQVIRQRLTTGTGARQSGSIGFGGAIELLDFYFDGGDIGQYGVFKQTELLVLRSAKPLT